MPGSALCARKKRERILIDLRFKLGCSLRSAHDRIKLLKREAQSKADVGSRPVQEREKAAHDAAMRAQDPEYDPLIPRGRVQKKRRPRPGWRLAGSKKNPINLDDDEDDRKHLVEAWVKI